MESKVGTQGNILLIEVEDRTDDYINDFVRDKCIITFNLFKNTEGSLAGDPRPPNDFHLRYEKLQQVKRNSP